MIKEEGFLLLVFSGVTGHGRMVVLFLRGNGGKVEHHRLRGEAAHFTVAREQRASQGQTRARDNSKALQLGLAPNVSSTSPNGTNQLGIKPLTLKPVGDILFNLGQMTLRICERE